MAETLRDRVLAALAIYAEGGTIRAARAQIGLHASDYYRALADDPELVARYRFAQESRADMMTDEAYEKMTDNDTDPKRLRPMVDGLLKLAALYDRKRFGDKLDVTVDAGPSLLPMLEARKQRALRPPCDLAQTIDAEYEAIPSVEGERASDGTSDERPPAPVDPFEP